MKKSRTPIICLGIFLLVYIFVVLLIPFVRNEVFWCSFVFSVIEYLVTSIVVVMAIKAPNCNEKVFELVKIRYSCIFLSICTLVNIFLMAYGKIPMWGAIISNVIVISIYIVIIVIFSTLKRNESVFESGLSQQIQEFKSYSVKVEGFIEISHTLELKNSLCMLLEVLKYSDPITPEQLFDLNRNINQCFNKLEELLYSEHENEAFECSKELLNLLKERNHLCKLYK